MFKRCSHDERNHADHYGYCDREGRPRVVASLLAEIGLAQRRIAPTSAMLRCRALQLTSRSRCSTIASTAPVAPREHAARR
jgi:hypothetical protein